jgi:hypothetical protein
MRPIGPKGEKVSKLVKKLEALIEALDAGKYNATKESLVNGSALKVIDQMELAEKYLTIKAGRAIAEVVAKIDIRDQDNNLLGKPLYLATIVKEQNIEAGVEMISYDLNMLASRGLILSALSRPSSMALVKRAGQALTHAVFSFVHVRPDRYEEAVAISNYGLTSQGTVATDAKQTGEIELDLLPCEFIACVRVTVAANMIEQLDGVKRDHLQETIDQYMAILPKGTEYLGTVPCGIDDLSIPYELHFRSALLPKVREVKLEYVRTCGYENNKLVQGNVILGIIYLDKSGRDIYRYTKSASEVLAEGIEKDMFEKKEEDDVNPRSGAV